MSDTYEVNVNNGTEYLIKQTLISYYIDTYNELQIVFKFEDIKIIVNSACACYSRAIVKEGDVDKLEYLVGKVIHFFTLDNDTMHFVDEYSTVSIEIVEDGNGYYPPSTSATIERPRKVDDVDFDEYSEES
jgi:hypothetical protein